DVVGQGVGRKRRYGDVEPVDPFLQVKQSQMVVARQRRVSQKSRPNASQPVWRRNGNDAVPQFVERKPPQLVIEQPGGEEHCTEANRGPEILLKLHGPFRITLSFRLSQ